MADRFPCEQMREDWNRRAREDAKYYVAFGRHSQDDDEFFATGVDLARGLERELNWLPADANRRAWRALEIGCGLGRLMLPLSRAFGEIHGVDVSDEMVRQARDKLRHVPHAHVHLTAGADLAHFADESFDFVYSYAVFQHIPSPDVVWEYLAEARRVLKAGGIFRFQVNGLPGRVLRYDTWSGVRITGDEIAEFARQNDFQLLALEGLRTQYQWVTLRKRPHGWLSEQARRVVEMARIRRITNAHSSEPLAPARGRFAAISLWIDGLPEDADLNTLTATIAGLEADLTYLGPPVHGLQQLNVELPASVETGLQPVRVFRIRKPLAAAAFIRVIPPGPLVPRIVSVTDGTELLSGTRIVTRSVKVHIEEVAHPEEFHATVDGREVRDLETFCTDPRPPLYEVNFSLPEAVGPGRRQLEMRLGPRTFAPVPIEVA